MSSFNINGPSSNQPLVQSSQNLGKDGGGGGSTGYMNMRNKKKKSSSQSEDDNSVFLGEDAADTFEKQDKPNKKNNKEGGGLIGTISGFMKNKTFAPKEEIKDAFVKHEEFPESAENEDFSEYNVALGETKDPLEDDEYEIIDDDEYYNGIDV